MDTVAFVPVFWDDGQTVTGLGIPDPNLSCQAAARQQHPVICQTLDVLQDRRREREPCDGVDPEVGTIR